MGATAYELVAQAEPEADSLTTSLDLPPASDHGDTRHIPSFPPQAEKPKRSAIILIVTGLTLVLSATLFAIFHTPSRISPDSDKHCPCSPSPSVPQYFQTSPQIYPGPTATGAPAFLAQTRVWTGAYVPNTPLQTDVPLPGGDGGQEQGSIFEQMGYLSPYVPSPGFGVEEYPLPAGAEVVQVQMVSRHGSRYPTGGANVMGLGERIRKAKGEGAKFKGELSFLNDWEYKLGMETLVPKGRQELFESGVLHAYMYGGLYNPRSKIIVRTTTQDRMLKSAENFLAGFFGLEWTRNATIEVIIEEKGFNNSLAGDTNCPNARNLKGGTQAATAWIGKYLANATERFADMVDGYTWTVDDTYAAQTMCPYETVAYGLSHFCSLFTYTEWLGFSYSVDLWFHGDFSFSSPIGRAAGIGYQQEVIARLNNHTLGYSGSQINTTLDSSTETFPLNQTLYFDFSHDTTIIAILTAFGLTQFSPRLSPDKLPGKHNFTVTHLTPFGARLDIEIIRTPKPVKADGRGYEEGGETKYIHFVLNQRTVPLGWSLPGCDKERVDGWCELGAFLKEQAKMEGLARFEEACFGEYDLDKVVGDGAPA